MAKVDDQRHESVLALLKEALPGESAADVIRRKARAIIAKHREWWTGPPFCPFALADLEGIVVEKAPCDIRSDGRIFSKGGKVYIQYTDGKSTQRIRFTICHELAHTLFPDCFRRERRRTQAEKAEWEFENLCNVAAAEFLFPVEAFSSDIGKGILPGTRIRDLALKYEASIDATAIRYIKLHPAPASVVFVEYRAPARGSVVSLHTQYSMPNDLFTMQIRKGLKINSKSIANRAYTEQQILGAVSESWMVHGTWARFRVEAIPLPKFESKVTADLAIVVYSR